ncbi:MAG: sulfite exporter TauE/SafE family protein [Planctomycetota bacterium]|nr:sulfite exporter TauE/SafE family protein [Planctomycetota bacterium]
MHTHELTLGLAFGLGALHALEPGHGKTAMLLYLTGERRSLLHPVVMGLSSAISHSISLIGIAAAVHLSHRLVVGEHHHAEPGVTQAMQWISCGLVLAVGLWMFWSAWKSRPSACGCKSHGLSGDHHDHDHQDQSHGQAGETLQVTGSRTSYSMSALLGAAFGLMPCPSAMAAYFSGLSSGSPMTAYTVIALFAAGIAVSLTLVGIGVQLFGNRLTQSRTWLAGLPWHYIRASLVTLVGLLYLANIVIG